MLKGIARGGATEFYWEHGDGTSTSWMPVTDPYNLGVSYAYTGAVGQQFLAVLHVRDGGGNEDADAYRVQIFESSDLSDPSHLDVRVNMAIDAGLWWLHTMMFRATYATGSPGYGEPYGYWEEPAYGFRLAATGAAVDAFQLHGHKVSGDYAGDPYVETVQRALNYLLVNAYAYSISGQPDTNGNGIGIVINHTSYLYDSRQTYIGGICAIALASSGAPNRVAAVGGDYVYGRAYHEIVQDIVDFFAWGQVDADSGRGGWRYYANYGGADMSTTQWPVLAMTAAEAPQPVGMGATVPQFVRDELPYFLDYTHHTGCDGDYGGYGYSYGSEYINCVKAAAGIICQEFLGKSRTDPSVTGALGFLYRHWNDDWGSWQYQPIHGNSYGMYAVMKAMRIPEPDMSLIVDYDSPPMDCTNHYPTGNTLDWYYAPGSGSPHGWAQAYTGEGLAYYSVRKQHADGSWDDTTGPNQVRGAFSTGWQILTLLKGVVQRTPVAVICDCDEQEYNLDQDIHVDGSCSYHEDPNRNIASYEWDFGYDGTTFTADATGVTATLSGGYPTTGIYPVALRVTDDNPDPETDIDTCGINAHPPPHCPHAFSGGPYIGWVNVPVTFDCSASWDPDNTIAAYDWDLDNDGLYGAEDNDCFGETSDATGVNPQWTWSAPFSGVIGLRVTDAAGEHEACSDYDYTTLEIGNHAPTADADGPYWACQSCTITLDGCASFDPDPEDSIVSYKWDLDNDGDFDDSSEEQPEFTVGSLAGVVYDICLKVTDSYGEYDIDCTSVVVVQNSPPVCSANGPYAEECQGSVTQIALDGSGSYDPDGDPLTFTWTTDCAGGSFDLPNGATPTLSVDSTYPLPLECTVTLTVDDGEFSDTCSTTVTVSDAVPPVVTVGPMTELWPPDHTYWEFDLSDFGVLVEDACGGLLDVDSYGTILSIYSDEPEDAQGNGDGATVDDIVILGSSAFKVRAERAGSSNGRVYGISFEVTDPAGNVSTAMIYVGVPHDGAGEPPIDDGAGAGYSVP